MSVKRYEIKIIISQFHNCIGLESNVLLIEGLFLSLSYTAGWTICFIVLTLYTKTHTVVGVGDAVLTQQ